MLVSDIQAQITATRAILATINAAFLAFADPTVQTYTYDSGQGIQTVRRHELEQLMKSRSSLQNELCTLQARLTGGGALTVRPDF